MKYPKTTSILAVIIMLVSTQHIKAQSKINNNVIGNGGGVASDSSFRLVGTLGQPTLGVSNDDKNSVKSGFWFQAEGIVTSVEEIETPEIPKEYRLEQNYPNPFNPTTTVEFALPQKSSVTIKLFDIQGREIAILAEEEYEVGKYKVVIDGQDLSSGIYFYQIYVRRENENIFSQTRKMLLVK